MELKYLLSPDETDRVVARLRASGFPATDGLIRTTYLDRPDGRLSRQAGEPRNVKLRIREYGPAPRWLWVDVKERDGQVSSKCRFRLDPRLLDRFLDGDEVDDSQAFRRARQVAGGPLVPVGSVTYRRLAVEGGDPLARVTIDREIVYVVGETPVLEERASILELKYGGGACWFQPEAEPVEYSKFKVLTCGLTLKA